MGTDEGAAVYMDSYGEGPGSETRHIIASFIKNGESVLDVGCGPGWNLDHFDQYGPFVVYKGIDYSERFIRVANERWKDRSYRVPFEVGDCRNLKAADGSYDVVILQDVLEHTNGYQRPIREALRVSRKRVIICMWRLLTPDDDKTNDDGDDGYGSDYNKDKFYQFLESLGYPFTEAETSPQANRWHHYWIIDKEAHV